MFLLIIPIFFRVIHQKDIRHLTRKNMQPKDITRCQSLNGNRYTNNNYDQYLINCEVTGTSFGFYGTTFSGHRTTTGQHMLHIINVNFDLHNCPITNCGFLSSMIYCNGPEQTFSMQGNTITECNNKETPLSNSNIVECNSKTATIKSNTITFSDISNSCRAFKLENSRNTIFISNQVTNANVGTQNQGSALFITKSGTGEPIQFSKCKFTNCHGGNGAVLVMNNLDYSIEIEELTIEKTKNELNNGSGYLTQLNYGGQHKNPEAKFTECHFLYLESDASSGGSIGLWFKGNQLNMSLIFERSTFENLHFLLPSVGGAITFIKENSNKDTHLLISECLFDNCSSSKAGAAICYTSPGQLLTITATTFKNTMVTESGQRGGAVYIEYQDEMLPVVISGCTFENANSNGCRGNAIVMTETAGSGGFYHFASIENTVFTDCGSSGCVIYYTIAFIMCNSMDIIFTSPSKSCGGVHRDSNSNLPSQIILNGPSKSGGQNGVALKIVDAAFNDVIGGAIHVVDCGIACKKTSFKKCLSKSGAGGAIYIKSDTDDQKEVTLEDVVVERCCAGYGGAVYLRSSAATIKRCNFSMNEAIFGRTDNSNSEVGGSAVFLAVKKGSITDTTFSENIGKGGSLFINNNFDHNSPYLEENSVEINRCTFKIEKNSKCSLFYLRGNGKSSFVLSNCLFTGKLAENSHYIDGLSLVKEAPKLLVKSCKFSYDSMSSLNLDPNNEFLNVDLNNQFFNYVEAKQGKLSTWKIIVAVVVPAAAVIVVVAVIVAVVIKKKYSNHNVVGDTEIAEDLQNNDINALKQTLI